MLAWIVDQSVGLGQALDPNATDDPARAVSYTQKWGVPTPLVAPKFNGVFWFWEIAPVSEWEPKLGYASSLRDAQALEVWNAAKSTILSGPYVRVPPYVFQSGLAPSPQPTPQPTPTPAPTPAPSVTKVVTQRAPVSPFLIASAIAVAAYGLYLWSQR